MSHWTNQCRHVHWARSGQGPTFNAPGGPRSGLVKLLEQSWFTSCFRKTHQSYCLNCTKFGQFILRKIIKIVATRCHFKAKIHQIRFWLGLRPRPLWGITRRHWHQHKRLHSVSYIMNHSIFVFFIFFFYSHKFTFGSISYKLSSPLWNRQNVYFCAIFIINK